MSESEESGERYTYPRAGVKADEFAALEFEQLAAELLHEGVHLSQLGPSMVKAYTGIFRRLPLADRSQVPLLYSMLGTGTAPLKMSKEDAAYQPKPVGTQQCSNCSSSYQNLSEGDVVCSQVGGTIDKKGWCRLWNSDRR